MGALAVAPQGGRVLVGIDGARPGSWLFVSDDAGTTWRRARGVAGAHRRDGDRVCAGRPVDRVRGRPHTALRSSGQRVLLLERRGCDVAGTRLEVDRRDLPAAAPGRDRHHRGRSAPAAHRSTPSPTGSCAGASTAAPRGPSPEPGCLRPSTSPRGARSNSQRAAAARSTTRPAGAPARARSTARSTAGPPGGPRASAFRPSCLAGRCWRSRRCDPARGLIYAATGRGLYATTDSGRTWRRALADPSTAVERDIVEPAVVVIASQRRGLVGESVTPVPGDGYPGRPAACRCSCSTRPAQPGSTARPTPRTIPRRARARRSGPRSRWCCVALGRACAPARAEELPVRVAGHLEPRERGDSQWSIDSSGVLDCASRRSPSAPRPSVAGAVSRSGVIPT